MKNGAASNSAETTAGGAIFRRLKALGVDYVFANAGTDFPPIIEGLAEARASGADLPTAVAVGHEHAAMGMAHGHFLLSGRPQAVMLHTNVGLANGVIGAINAACEHIPLLLLSGHTPTTEGGRFGARTGPDRLGPRNAGSNGSGKGILQMGLRTPGSRADIRTS